jgi:Domain of unknown function (DUF1707)/Cell wall-active antibiotics response 4TMS YvqF
MVDREQHPVILASDADRERSVSKLRDAVVEGRLTLEEFSDRVGLAQVARLETELEALVKDLPSAPPASVAIPAESRHRAIFSQLVRRGPWELPGRSSYSSIFGTIALDLRSARLLGSEAELTIFNLFGTVTVIVPEEVMVSVEGGAWFASEVIDAPDSPPVPDAPRLRIRVSGACGTLHVRSRHAAPGGPGRLLGTG